MEKANVISTQNQPHKAETNHEHRPKRPDFFAADINSITVVIDSSSPVSSIAESKIY